MARNTGREVHVQRTASYGVKPQRDWFFTICNASLGILLGLLIVVTVLSIMGKFDNTNTDPRNGRVDTPSGSKYCDGTTLIYEFHRGGDTIANSPECAR